MRLLLFFIEYILYIKYQIYIYIIHMDFFFFFSRIRQCVVLNTVSNVWNLYNVFFTPPSKYLFAVWCAHGHKLSQVLYLLFHTVLLPAIKHLYNVLFSGSS